MLPFPQQKMEADDSNVPGSASEGSILQETL